MTQPADPGALGAYLQLGLRAQNALRAAGVLLRARQAMTADPDESRAITPALLRIEAQIQGIQSDLALAATQPTAVVPPTAAQIAQLQHVAGQLDQMTAVSVVANDVIGAATTVAQRWSAAA